MPLSLRLATTDDADQVRDVYAPYCQTPISFELEPPSVDEMHRRMSAVLDQNAWLVCADVGMIVGYAYAAPHRERAAYRWSVDTSVYIHERHHRRGIGRALYTSLFQLLRHQGYVNAYAGVTLPNPGSVGLHEALGFTPVGVYTQVGYKYGAWHDVGWYQLLLQPRTLEPRPPRPLADVYGTSDWHSAIAAGVDALTQRAPR
jgi:phosphinothricin acetyltransferase